MVEQRLSVLTCWVSPIVKHVCMMVCSPLCCLHETSLLLTRLVDCVRWILCNNRHDIVWYTKAQHYTMLRCIWYTPQAYTMTTMQHCIDNSCFFSTIYEQVVLNHASCIYVSCLCQASLFICSVKQTTRCRAQWKSLDTPWYATVGGHSSRVAPVHYSGELQVYYSIV